MRESFNMNILNISSVSLNHVGYPFGMKPSIVNSTTYLGSLSKWYVYDVLETWTDIKESLSSRYNSTRSLYDPIFRCEYYMTMQNRYKKFEECIDRNVDIISRRLDMSIPFTFDIERFIYTLIESGKLSTHSPIKNTNKRTIMK